MMTSNDWQKRVTKVANNGNRSWKGCEQRMSWNLVHGIGSKLPFFLLDYYVIVLLDHWFVRCSFEVFRIPAKTPQNVAIEYKVISFSTLDQN